MNKNKKKETEQMEEQKEQLTEEQVASEAPANDTEAAAEENEAEKAEEKEEPSLETQLEELKDKYLRQIAEFDNYRKRTLKEKAELILNGGEKVMSSLLPILDDMERAQQNMEKATDLEALKEGLNLVFQKFQKVLENQGLKKIETEDKDFDTDYHEAIAMVPVGDDKQKGKVVDCVQTGYMLNEKVLRHAKVAIGQ